MGNETGLTFLVATLLVCITLVAMQLLSGKPGRCPICGGRGMRAAWVPVEQHRPVYGVTYACAKCGCQWQETFHSRFE